MATKAVLNLSLAIPVGEETEVAKHLQAQMQQAEWQVLRQFAQAVTFLGESAAAGTHMVVLPMRAEGMEATIREASRALNLKPVWE